ncbi:helix-turn-helix transcriptional regulator [Paenarthrobacter nitroguajacolicus]|uniref:Helix-turn-helix transcriptional regulator n=1 Tax=Paenarthrobacter nitroguajacolicus TaxID=211146 RepID=A0A558GPS2_PAENT|nr:helix-turn-helix transcriptional regulator [Paenarthrobacter nitroguajacolicus]
MKVAVRRQEQLLRTVREAGPLVRELREERAWSQAELARRASVSRTFVIDLESGKASVETSKFMDVFQALGFEIAIRDSETGAVRW